MSVSRNRYSVPCEFAGQRVSTRLYPDRVCVVAEDRVVARHDRLADRGQIELSMTPYGHPIVPLLNDFNNMRDAQPDAPAPHATAYPGGVERSRWHLQEGLAVFEHYFGRTPEGVWLSEGGVSHDALVLLDELNIRWTATGEGVWRNSLALSGTADAAFGSKQTLFKPAQVAGLNTRVAGRCCLMK